MLFSSKEEPIVISVGGSLIVPNGGINTEFLTKLNIFVRKYVKQGKRFFLVAGGGNIARHYRDAGKKVVGDMSEEDLDWLGVHTTHLNGHLLRTIFQDISHPRIIQNYERKLYNWKEPIVVAAGWKPGWSTDYDAVLLARDYKAQLIINLSNIDWVYDKDPNKFKDAKPIEKITWEEMEALVGNKWSSGLNAPFDPIATKLAEKLKLTVIVSNGNDFDNLEKIIEGDVFKGTVITPFRFDASYYDKEYYFGKKSGYRIATRMSTLGKLLRGLANFYRAFLIKIFINPKNCLDVGCGTGGLVRKLRMFGIDAYGVEISQTAIDLADSSLKPYLKQASSLKIPYEDNSFELVLTFDLLQHIERSKIQKALVETARVSQKYLLHKIYTKENIWITLFHSTDYSNVSWFRRGYWKNILGSVKNFRLLSRSIVKLPLFIESLFLLKKNS